MTSREYIQQKMKSRKTTLSEVSELMGYSSAGGLHNILRNPKRLTIEQTIKLAEILKLKFHSLATRIAKS